MLPRHPLDVEHAGLEQRGLQHEPREHHDRDDPRADGEEDRAASGRLPLDRAAPIADARVDLVHRSAGSKPSQWSSVSRRTPVAASHQQIVIRQAIRRVRATAG